MTNKSNRTIEPEKLREEIKSLKLQRAVLVLSLVGGVGGFVIQNFVSIQTLLYPPPSLKVITVDPFLRVNGSLSISKLENGDWNPVVKTKVIEGQDWIKLSEGSFAISIQLNDESFYSSELQLTNGENRVLLVDRSISGPMRITMTNNTPSPRPNAPVMLDIKSSGRGYLWLFDVTPNQQMTLIYPPENAPALNHEILPEKNYHLPDENGFGVFAGDRPGLETIAAVVTATQDQPKAFSIASQYTKSSIVKASGGQVNVDWGAVAASYHIRDNGSGFRQP